MTPTRTRVLLAALLLAGCAVGPRSYDASVPPVPYRAVKAATGAAAVLTLERVGVPQPLATILGVGGPVVLGKLARPQHEHPLGDWVCDLTLGAAVVPIVLAKPRLGRWNLQLGLVAGVAWGGAMAAVDQLCIP